MKPQQSDRQPLWSEEFSVRKADERYVSRRQLTKFLTLSSMGMFAGNLWILAKSWMHRGTSYPVRAIARLGEIPVGGVKLFEYPGPQDRCLLVRTGEDAYVAYSQKCTHLSCTVYYSAKNDRLAVRAMKGTFRYATARYCKDRPRAPSPVSCSNGEVPS